jgi:hypothetical protein
MEAFFDANMAYEVEPMVEGGEIRKAPVKKFKKK